MTWGDYDTGPERGGERKKEKEVDGVIG